MSDAQSILADPDFPALKNFVIETTGLAYFSERDDDLAGRLARRWRTEGVRDCRAYLDRLRNGDDGEEMDAMIGELTIGETYFFRHREQFDAIRDVVLPDLLRRNAATRRLTIWSVGCATGAETYTLSILLKDEFAHSTAGWEITLLGSDINKEFLDKARAGKYVEWSLRTVSDDVRRRCFRNDGKVWTLLPKYREGVAFLHHNLVDRPFVLPLGSHRPFDLVVCRNVMIYFSNEIFRETIGQFHRCLSDGGWLVVGHAENHTETFRSFRTVPLPRVTLYQKDGDRSPESPPMRDAVADAAVGPRTLPEPSLFQAEPGCAANVDPSVWKPFEFVPLSTRDESRDATADGNSDVAPIAAPSGLVAIRLLADQGQWDEALSRCRAGTTDDPLNSHLYLLMGMICEGINDFKGAEVSFRQAIYLDRRLALAHHHLGRILREKRDLPGAARAFKNAHSVLESSEGTDAVAGGDGLTVSELKEWVELQLRALAGEGLEGTDRNE